MTKRTKHRSVAITESDLHLLSAALGTYTQHMEKAAHAAYAFTTPKQRSKMINHGLAAIDLRNRLFKEWQKGEGGTK